MPSSAEDQVRAAVRELIDECRASSLWFLRPNYYPATDEERLQVLDYIARSGDRETFRRASALRQWFSHRSSARSADS